LFLHPQPSELAFATFLVKLGGVNEVILYYRFSLRLYYLLKMVAPL